MFVLKDEYYKLEKNRIAITGGIISLQKRSSVPYKFIYEKCGFTDHNENTFML